MFQDLARMICLIDVRFDKAASDWITLQEENSSCKFGALQGIKVVRAGSYHTRPENQANDFEKVYSTPCEKLCSCTFYISIDHLFNNFESEKRNYCFGVKSGKSLEYWIQQSVQTLCKPAQGNLDVMKGQVSGKILSL